LSAEDQIENSRRQGKLLSSTHNVDSCSHLQINRKVASQSVFYQGPVRLKTAANIKHQQTPARYIGQPSPEEVAALSQNQIVRICESWVEPIRRLPIQLLDTTTLSHSICHPRYVILLDISEGAQTFFNDPGLRLIHLGSVVALQFTQDKDNELFQSTELSPEFLFCGTAEVLRQPQLAHGFCH
jgi:hypothetical protein